MWIINIIYYNEIKNIFSYICTSICTAQKCSFKTSTYVTSKNVFLLPLQYFWHLYAVTVCFNLWLPNYVIAFSFQNVSKFMHSLFFRSIHEKKLFSNQVRRTANRPIYDKSCISDMYILKGFAFFLYVMHEYERIIHNAPCSMPIYHFKSFQVTILCSWFFKFVLF